MTGNAWMTRTAWLTLSTLTGLGCGSSETGDEPMTCGPGTHAENGACVPDGPDGGAGAAGTAGAGGGAGSGGSAGAATGGTAGAAGGGAAGAGGGTVDPSGDCPKGLAGPSLVEITAPNGIKYCIDSTEVTWGHYRAFYDEMRFNIYDQPALCEWNESFEAMPGKTYPDAHPVNHVNWCQALAYCEWAGKRLCGRVGGGGIGYEGVAPDANVQEWYGVCSNGGTTRYPYGNSFEPNACRDTYDSATEEFVTVPVGSYPGCRGTTHPFDSVHDLLGNVFEWTAECEFGPGRGKGYCTAAGATASGTPEPEPERDCTKTVTWELDSAMTYVGFRCCANTSGSDP